MLGKDKTAWARKPFYRHQTARCNVLRQRSGPHKSTELLSMSHTFQKIFTAEMVDIIVRHTNAKAISTYATYNEDNPDKKQLKWNNLTSQEFRAFLGVLIMSGANNSNTDHTTEMWRPNSYPLYRASFGLGRFWNILRFIRFDNAHTRADRLKEDKAAPIADIWTMLNANLSKMYKPDECLTVDEQLYPYRGRTRFTQYMPSKPAKYGIKVWWICDSKNAYPLRGLIYTGKSKDGREINQGERVVKELAAPYKGSGRNITMDNFFTTLPLTNFLLSWNLTTVGTLRKNKKYIPAEMMPSKIRDEYSTVFGFQKNSTLCSYVPKRGKAVIMLSSMHYDNTVCDETRKKPEIIKYYNSTKGGVDRMDQMIGRYTTQRQTNRWPLAFFFNIIDVASLATYIIYYENNKMIPKKTSQRRIFLRQLSEELCMPHIQERSQNCQIMRHFSTKMAIESIYRLPIKSTQTSETNVPIKQLDSTVRIKVVGCCKMCLNGETRKRRKTRKSCVNCNEPVCDEHSITIHKCGNCRQL